MKTLRFLLLTAAALLALVSCDFAPVMVSMHVTDEAGHDRLDPYSDYFIGENITAVYDGQTYPAQMTFLSPATKVYAPRFFGLEWRYDREYGYYLCFGEFDGATSQDITVTYNWPDGTSDTIHVTHVRVFGDTWRLNGKRVYPPLSLVK